MNCKKILLQIFLTLKFIIIIKYDRKIKLFKKKEKMIKILILVIIVKIFNYYFIKNN
jgi:hypothetical protein